jgi:hypothetical protein
LSYLKFKTYRKQKLIKIILDFKVFPKVTCEDVLNVIKSELKNANRLSSNIFEDVQSAKTVFDIIYCNDTETFKGYIQEIKMDRFGMLLYSEKQVIFFFKLTFL